MKESPPSHVHVPGTRPQLPASGIRAGTCYAAFCLAPPGASSARRNLCPTSKLQSHLPSLLRSSSPKNRNEAHPQSSSAPSLPLLWEKVPGQPFTGQLQQRTAIEARPRTTPTPSCTPLPSALCRRACWRLLATARHLDDDTSPSVVCARQLEDLRCDGGGTWIRCPAAQCEGFLVQFVVIAIACPALAR